VNTTLRDHPAFRAEALQFEDGRATRMRTFDVFDSYMGTRVGTVPQASADDVRAAFDYAAAYQPVLTRYGRSRILECAAALLRERIEHASDPTSPGSGLSMQDSRFEIGRVADVFRFASAMERRAACSRVCVRTGRDAITRLINELSVETVNVWKFRASGSS
jgi:acyl-CoA reductase-like NAD-dependent aldehyde dehydrogenase